MGGVSPVGPEGKKTIIWGDFGVLACQSGQALVSSGGYRMYPKPREVFMLELEIAPRAVADGLKSGEPGLILLDVREPWEVATAQIAGSKLLPMGEIPSRVFQELDPEAHIITVCHSGVRSLNVAAWMRNQGFEKVQSMSGGIDSWSREIDPAVPRY
jgi:rhodanese-related sulfurtransferase